MHVLCVCMLQVGRKGDAATWWEALEQWLETAASGDEFTVKAAKAVAHELAIYRHRQKLVREAELRDSEPETPEPSEDDEEAETEAQSDRDPLLLL